MDKLDFDEIHDTLIEPFLGQFLGQESVEKLEPLAKEVGRIIYQNDSITVNWGLVVGALIAGLLLLLKLFFGLTLFDVMDAMTGASYGSTGYGYGAPASSSYTAPSTGYGTPASYSSRSYGEEEDQVQLTPEQKALYPELSKLQDEINQLKENEIQLRNQIFYGGNQGDLSNAASAQIAYSY